MTTMADSSKLHDDEEIVPKEEVEFNIVPEQLRYPDIYYDLVVKSEPSKVNQIYTCDLCNDKFDEHNSFMDHINFHKQIDAYVCPVQNNYVKMENSKLKSHPRKKVYNCSVCEKGFSQNFRLEKHLQSHRDTLECKICEKKFPNKWYLEIHMRQHTGEKPFSCSVCSKAFAAKSVLKIHMRIHSGERQFQCSTCNKKFLNKSHLSEHLRIHAGIKPFECTVCSKVFSQNSKLTLHMRVHTGEKPFMCCICPRGFAYKDALEIHVRTHTGLKPYECSVCNKKLLSASNLKSHMNLHTRPVDFRTVRANNRLSALDVDNLKKWQKGNDPKCKCGKEYKTISNLARHTRVHTGEKLFECAECGNKFTHKSVLSRHIKEANCSKPRSKKKKISQ